MQAVKITVDKLRIFKQKAWACVIKVLYIMIDVLISDMLSNLKSK